MLVNNFLEQSTKIRANKIALIYQNKKYSYFDLEKAANSLANCFIQKGLQKQDRVAIYLENSVESIISIFGILKSSGIFVIVNPQVKAKKANYIFNDCNIKILITDNKHLKEISSILCNCPDLELLVIIDKQISVENVSKFKQKIIFFDKILAEYPAVCPLNKCNEDDLASLIYTSGSTGSPKGVMLSHKNIVSASSSIIEYLENTDKDIILNCLPLSFDYGLYQILMSFRFGGTIVLEKNFLYPYSLIDLIIKEKITGLPIVPSIAAILLKLKNLKKYDFSNLRYITSTAQSLSPKHIKKLQEIFPKTKIYSMYGLTECKRVSYLPPEDILLKPDSVGIAMPNVNTFIVDGNKRIITKPGKIGELVVTGCNVMKGYWNLPEETKKCLKTSSNPNVRILYTGDLFKMDDEGYLYFVSRKDDIIKTAGERVSPKEIENVLYEIEDINEAGVIGVKDEILGNAIKAFVALDKNSKITKNDIFLHCKKNLENFMIPKYIEIRERLPKTPTGKISKKDLI